MGKATGHTITSDSALGAAKIQRSLRFNKGDNAVLTRSPSSTTNSTKQTLSFWFKVCSLIDATNQGVLFAGGDDGSYAYVQFWSNTFYFGNSAGPYWNGSLRLRDFSAWYHATIVIDTTQSTADDRQKFYLNGVQQSKGNAGSNNPNQNDNYEYLTNSSWTYYIGKRAANDMNFDGYMAEINFVQGQALEPTQFGFTDPQTGIWMPKRYEGTYGTNGFYLDFSNNSSTAALGIDKSPNGNDWTTSNFSVSSGLGNDSFVDTPTNTFPTLNPNHAFLNGSSSTAENGNLQWNGQSNNQAGCPATMAFPTTGKWYWEIRLLSSNANFSFGIVPATYSNTTNPANPTGSIGYAAYGSKIVSGSETSSWAASFDNSDDVGAALDMDNKKITFYKDNSAVGTIDLVSGYENVEYLAWIKGDTASQLIQGAINFGGNGFVYTPPTGFKALNSENLPPITPSIVRPQKHFKALLYTGNNSTNTVTGLEFEPDMIWIKSRGQNYANYLFDSLRTGGSGQLVNMRTDSVAAEPADGTSISDVFHGGFYLGGTSGINDAGSGTNGIVAWCWKAGGAAAVSNTSGSITSSVSANQEGGFSIVKWTGTNGTGTVGHGLGKAPKWIIIRRRNSDSSWVVYHDKVGNTKRLTLDSVGSESSGSANWFNNTSPTSTTFSVGADGGSNGSTDGYVAWCWSEIPGFSKFGSYKGNNNSDGTYIHLGFRPAWVMIKNREAGSTEWYILDSSRDPDNPADKYLSASAIAQEQTYVFYDFLSEGFKLRNTGGAQNPDNQEIIYMAFAEQPGVTPFDTFPNAR
jgi:hypothetical protein